MKSLLIPQKKSKIESHIRENWTSIFLKEKIFNNDSISDKVILLLIRDLLRLGWAFSNSDKMEFRLRPPSCYNKETIKKGMSFSRNKIIEKNRQWIDLHINRARMNLASGLDVLKSDIVPVIEVCRTQKQNDLFRAYRYYWSSPASEYVGRRIRIIVRDAALPYKPVIGIAAIGSSIIRIADRDRWIGWDLKTRTQRLVYIMDAYVVGALPPYNDLLGGKLMTYILASNELRDIYKNKYQKTKTVINKRKNLSDLALIMITSLYGLKSSQYNRLRFGKDLLCKPIGETSGFGTLHISNETFLAMKELIEKKGHKIFHTFGMGPNWRMRVIRLACEELDLDADIILKHSFKRGLFALPLAVNWKSFLNGRSKTLIYRNLPLKKLYHYWQKRWLEMRKKNRHIVNKVKKFQPEHFKIR